MNNLSAIRFDRNWEHLPSISTDGFPSKDLKVENRLIMK